MLTCVGLDRKQSGFSFLLENLRPAITNNIHKAAICIKAPVFIIFEQHPTSLIMKKLYAIILFIYSMSAGAQSTTPTVVASSGGFFSNTAGMLSFTVGELAAVTTLSSANNYLTQGFQQPSDFGVYVPPIKDENFSVSVYTNPSTGLFNLSITTSNSMHLELSLYDLLGQKIMGAQQNLSRGKNLIPVDLHKQITGMYPLKCTFTNLVNGEKNKSYSKLHLIY